MEQLSQHDVHVTATFVPYLIIFHRSRSLSPTLNIESSSSREDRKSSSWFRGDIQHSCIPRWSISTWISPNNRDHHTQCCLSLSSLPSGVFLASLQHNVFLGHYRKPDMTRHEKGAGRIERRAGGRSPCFSTSYFCAKSNTPCTWVFLILTPLQSIKETASHQC